MVINQQCPCPALYFVAVAVMKAGQQPLRELEGTTFCRIQGGSVHPYICLYVRPSSLGPPGRFQAPLAGPQAFLAGPQTPLTGPQAPLRGPHAPLAGSQTPLTGYQTPLMGPQTPLTGLQGPPAGP